MTKITVIFLLGLIGACSKPNVVSNEARSMNPFDQPSPLTFNYPQFDTIEQSHYLPAFAQGMAKQLAEIDLITSQTQAPTFANTIVALERSGQQLKRVRAVFFNLTSAHTNETMETLRLSLAPKLATHRDNILLNSKLFNRITELQQQSLALDIESKRLLDETYKDFIRAGAQLNSADKTALRGINIASAELQTKFSQNVLKEVNASAIVVDQKSELLGLSSQAIDSAAQQAAQRDLTGKYVLPLLNTSGQPVLAQLNNRSLRERIYQASIARGSRGGEFDNRSNFTQLMKLRAQRAELLGFNNHAQYSLATQTAKTVSAVNQRLASLAPAAVAKAKTEAAALQQLINNEGNNFTLAPWDWAFYSEKLRQQLYDFDQSQLRPYFELDNVLNNGVFFAAEQLFGISFEERFDLPLYHADLRVFTVTDNDGSTLAILIADFYARASKRGGAWMTSYVSQSSLQSQQPVIAIHLNISKPSSGDASLLSFDEVTTLFHEFGHALHGMFSNVQYPSFSGTSVPRDFVEFPSQVNEMWAIWPEVLKNYARHYQTGTTIPDQLLEKVLASQKFNQGFAVSEYLAAAILDQAWHQLSSEQVPNADQLINFEQKVLDNAGIAMPAIPPRYSSTYFSHIVGAYSAGYYAYIWSEVLDADTVLWFQQNQGLNRKNGEHFRQRILSKGGSEDAMSLYQRFRGANATIQPLLKRLGFSDSSSN